jgi:hypothetical protein
MSHHVAVRLPHPDGPRAGREIVVDYRCEIVPVMHRIHDEAQKGREGNPEDYALIVEWADMNPERLCSMAEIAAGSISGKPDATCGGKHPPALAEPFAYKPYRPKRQPGQQSLFAGVD